MTLRTLQSSNNKSNCKSPSPTHTPINIKPSNQCIQCSLTCQIQFEYSRSNWDMSAVRIADSVFQKNDATTNNILRFYVNNFNVTPYKDITFNGNHYQLEFIEFYLPGLHTMPVEGDDDDKSTSTTMTHQVEMVMCHRSVDEDDNGQWVNVSVFAIAQNSYSLSNTFFYELINTILIKKLNTDASVNKNTQYVYNSDKLSDTTSPQIMNGINWMTPYKKNGLQQAISRSGDADAVGAPAVNITVGEFWNPYQALPANKAFFSYLGEFPYAPCKFFPNQKVSWIIMQTPVSMFQSEYNILRTVITNSSIYNYNHGDLYRSIPIAIGRHLMYNNGDLVVGNQDQDKFYVKCVKANDNNVPKGPTASLSNLDEIADIRARTVANNQNAIFTAYQPEQSPMSAIVFCIVISFVFFTMFACANWIHSKSSENGENATSENIQYGIIAFLSIGIFVLYGLSFVMATAMVGAQPFGIIILTVVLLAWNAYPMNFLNGLFLRWWGDEDNPSSILWKIPAIFIKGLALLIWASLIFGGFNASFAPSIYLNGRLTPTYSYYYTKGNPADPVFYIGVNAAVRINFAGYLLEYLNEYTVEDRIKTKAVPSSNYFVALSPEFLSNHEMQLSLQPFTPGSDSTVTHTELFIPFQAPVVNEDVCRLAIKYIILQSYDSKMKQDALNPLQNFISAIQEVLPSSSVLFKVYNWSEDSTTSLTGSEQIYNLTVTFSSQASYNVTLKSQDPKLYAYLDIVNPHHQTVTIPTSTS